MQPRALRPRPAQDWQPARTVTPGLQLRGLGAGAAGPWCPWAEGHLLLVGGLAVASPWLRPRRGRNAWLPAANVTAVAAAADAGYRNHDDEDTEFARVFSWLGFAPKRGSPCHRALLTYFPGALPGTAVFQRTRMLLETEHGFQPENTAYGLCVCPDELSTKSGGLRNLMQAHWGTAFFFGGMGGAPFAGRSGFAAFSEQVPAGGNAILLFGPHVGISLTGEVGSYSQRGRQEPIPTCRACIAAYNQCLTELADADIAEPADMQQAWLRTQLAPHVKDIARANSPMAALAYQSYELVAESVYSIVNARFGSGKLALIGGIHINTPDDCEDYFLPVDFDLISDGTKPTDHMDVFNKWT
mmetsp:Transcript_91967/g.297608  ORF Transcript_91967/g.297608 Transcript_91967/m.297608 type:complete len:357 (-) Transcript_91967:125-1195(-)